MTAIRASISADCRNSATAYRLSDAGGKVAVADLLDHIITHVALRGSEWHNNPNFCVRANPLSEFVTANAMTTTGVMAYAGSRDMALMRCSFHLALLDAV